MDDDTTFKARRFAHAKVMQVAYVRTDKCPDNQVWGSAFSPSVRTISAKNLGIDYLVNKAYLGDSFSYPSYSLSQTL